MALDPLNPAGRDGAARALGRRRELGLLALLWAAASVVFFLLAEQYVTPMRYHDEFFYWGIAKSLAHDDGLSWRGGEVPLRSFLYPLYIAPAFRLAGSVEAQYAVVHAFNAVAASAVVIPTYYMARPLASHRLSLVAAGLALCVPAMNYTGIIGTESLAYLVCAAALAAILLACRTPRAGNALLALALCGVAILVRTQFVVLPLVLAMTLALTALMRGRTGAAAYLRDQRLLIALLAAGAVLAAVVVLLMGSRAVGLYAAALQHTPHSLGEFWFWLRSFAADSLLVCGILPAIATWAMLGSRANRRDASGGPLLALALVLTIVLVLQLAWFSASNDLGWRANHTFYERYLFYIAPLLFAAAASAVGRISLRAALGATLAALVVVAGFSHEAIDVPFSYDAFSLAYLGFLLDQHENWIPHATLILVALTASMGALLSLSLWRRPGERVNAWAGALAVILPLFVLLITQAKAWTYGSIYTSDSLAQQPRPPDFAERAGSGPMALLAADPVAPVRPFQAEFWNPSIRRVYINHDQPIATNGIHLNSCRFSWTATGVVRETGCGPPPRRWYVSARDLTLRFRDQTRTVHGAGTRGGQLLELGGGRPQLLAMTKGIALDARRIEGPRFTVWSFLRSPGHLRVVLSEGTGTTLRLPDGRTTRITGRRAVVFLPIDAGGRVSVFSVEGGEAPRVSVVQLREADGRWVTIG